MQTLGVIAALLFVSHHWLCSAIGVRLSGGSGSTTSSGQLEVFEGEEWRPVCADGFGPLEGQVACRQLGYPFVLGIGETRMPVSSEVVDSISCAGREANITECSVTTAEQCSSESGLVTLTCDDVNNSTEGLVLIFFEEYGFLFTIMAPDSDVYAQNCNYTFGPCSGTHTVPLEFLQLVITVLSFGSACGGVDLTGLVDCTNPSSAIDVQLSGGSGSTTSSGKLEVFQGEEWRPVCADGFGPLEGQVACRQLGYPFVLGIDETRIPVSSEVVDSISCAGSEADITECSVTTAEQCSSESGLVTLTCDDVNNSTEGLVLIFFEEYGFLFTIMAPDSDVYAQNCNYTFGPCSGTHTVPLEFLQLVIAVLPSRSACGDVDLTGLVDCTNPPTEDNGAVMGSNFETLPLFAALAIVSLFYQYMY